MRGAPDIFEGDMGDLINLGTIAEVDLARGLVRVKMGDVETSWIRWSSGRAGATRIWSPPSAGEQVVLVAPHGDLAAAFCFGAIASEANPPAGNSLRELMIFSDGAIAAYDPEAGEMELLLPEGGKLRILAAGGVEIEASAGVTIKGPVSIEGDVSIQGSAEATGDVKAGAISLKTHKHIGVQAGGGVTGVPQ